MDSILRSKERLIIISKQTQDIVTLKTVKNTIVLRKEDEGVRKESETSALYER